MICHIEPARTAHIVSACARHHYCIMRSTMTCITVIGFILITPLKWLVCPALRCQFLILWIQPHVHWWDLLSNCYHPGVHYSVKQFSLLAGIFCRPVQCSVVQGSAVKCSTLLSIIDVNKISCETCWKKGKTITWVKLVPYSVLSHMVNSKPNLFEQICLVQ